MSNSLWRAVQGIVVRMLGRDNCLGCTPARYAMRTTRLPTSGHSIAGCPASGWIHEAGKPWRVITSSSPIHLANVFGGVSECWVARYDGTEATIDLDDWLPQGIATLVCGPYPLDPGWVHAELERLGRDSVI